MTSRCLFEIQDICDLIAVFLSTTDCLALCRVSRQCYSSFFSHIWRHVRITQSTQINAFLNVLPLYGHLIRDVRITGWIGHKDLPSRLHQLCPNVTSLAAVDRALPEENRVFVDGTTSGASLPVFHALRSLELYLTGRECQQFITKSLQANELGYGSWSHLKRLEITLSSQWQGNNTVYFSLQEFLDAFPKCHKLVLRGMNFKIHASSFTESESKDETLQWDSSDLLHPLEDLRLPHCCMDIPNLLIALKGLCRLRSIQLGGHYSGQDIRVIFDALPIYCPDMTSFTMLAAQKSMSNDLWIALFRSFPDLQSFHVGGSRMDDLTLSALSRLCSRVKELSLFHSAYVTYRGIQEIVRSYSHLVVLDLTAVELSSEVFAGQFEWACKLTLRELSMNRLHVQPKDHTAIRKRLGQLINLERLTLWGSNIHVEMILVASTLECRQEQEQQPFFSRLEFINIGRLVSPMTLDQTRQFIAAVPHIQEVCMDGCFNGEAIEWLAVNAPHLRSQSSS